MLIVQIQTWGTVLAASSIVAGDVQDAGRAVSVQGVAHQTALAESSSGQTEAVGRDEEAGRSVD